MTTPTGEFEVFEPRSSTPDSRGGTNTRFLPSPNSQQLLRRHAIAAEASSTSTLDLSQLWQELTHGSSRVVDSFFSEDRCYLLLAKSEKSSPQPIEGRRLAILEAVLGGLRQKNIAIDLGLAPSTVALNSRLALQGMGLSCRPSRAHPLLMLAASAANGPTLGIVRSATVTQDDRELRVVGTLRPDRQLEQLLPCAELAVIRSLVEGFSYEEIALQRGTSTRTIANQITAVFRRLRVSGRNELVQRLFFDETLGKHMARRPTESLVPPNLAEPKQSPTWDAARRSA